MNYDFEGDWTDVLSYCTDPVTIVVEGGHAYYGRVTRVSRVVTMEAQVLPGENATPAAPVVPIHVRQSAIVAVAEGEIAHE